MTFGGRPTEIGPFIKVKDQVVIFDERGQTSTKTEQRSTKTVVETTQPKMVDY